MFYSAGNIGIARQFGQKHEALHLDRKQGCVSEVCSPVATGGWADLDPHDLSSICFLGT